MPYAMGTPNQTLWNTDRGGQDPLSRPTVITGGGSPRSVEEEEWEAQRLQMLNTLQSMGPDGQMAARGLYLIYDRDQFMLAYRKAVASIKLKAARDQFNSGGRPGPGAQ